MFEENIFFRPDEAMFENWQKFVSTEIIYSVLENTQITPYIYTLQIADHHIIIYH